jgi:hypothetical protein
VSQFTFSVVDVHGICKLAESDGWEIIPSWLCGKAVAARAARRTATYRLFACQVSMRAHFQPQQLDIAMADTVVPQERDGIGRNQPRIEVEEEI